MEKYILNSAKKQGQSQERLWTLREWEMWGEPNYCLNLLARNWSSHMIWRRTQIESGGVPEWHSGVPVRRELHGTEVHGLQDVPWKFSVLFWSMCGCEEPLRPEKEPQGGGTETISRPYV